MKAHPSIGCLPAVHEGEWTGSHGCGTPEPASSYSCEMPSAVRLCRICSPQQLHSLSFNHPIVTILPTPSWYAPLPAITQALQHPTDTCGRARPLLSLIFLRVMLCLASAIILHCLYFLLYKNPGTPSLSMELSQRMNRSFKTLARGKLYTNSLKRDCDEETHTWHDDRGGDDDGVCSTSYS